MKFYAWRNAMALFCSVCQELLSNTKSAIGHFVVCYISMYQTKKQNKQNIFSKYSKKIQANLMYRCIDDYYRWLYVNYDYYGCTLHDYYMTTIDALHVGLEGGLVTI